MVELICLSLQSLYLPLRCNAAFAGPGIEVVLGVTSFWLPPGLATIICQHPQFPHGKGVQVRIHWPKDVPLPFKGRMPSVYAIFDQAPLPPVPCSHHRALVGQPHPSGKKRPQPSHGWFSFLVSSTSRQWHTLLQAF